MKVVVGGGMGGLVAARLIQNNGKAEVTLIDRKDFFEVTYAQLRALVDPEGIGAASRTPYREAFRGTFVQGEVTALEPKAVRLADGLPTLAQRTEAGRQAYQRFVTSTGSPVSWPRLRPASPCAWPTVVPASSRTSRPTEGR